MKLLILGGTMFLGRHLVDAGLAAGHEVSIFTRGLHGGEDVPEGVERLTGDRDGRLDALVGRSWDAVVDTSGFVPRVVRASAELLAGSVGHYTFVSSGSVYRDARADRRDENYPVGTMTDEQLRALEEVKPPVESPASAYDEFYGPLKALSERAAEEAMPGRVLNVRAGLIVGPYDYSDRFTYWPRRVAEGGEVLAPAPPERPVQFVDARDLASWIVRSAEAGTAGTFNATGPDYRLTFGRFLEECRTATGSDARFVWVEEKFLLEAGVEPWSEVPLWIPESNEAMRYFLSVGNERAVAAGLTFRPLSETVRDTLAWDATRPPDTERHAGLDREREAEVLAAWKARAD